MSKSEDVMEQMFEKALGISEKHLEAALREDVELAPYTAVAMIEAAVNHAVDMTSPEDVIAILQDLIGQIDSEMDEEDEDEEDEDGDDEEDDDSAK